MALGEVLGFRAPRNRRKTGPWSRRKAKLWKPPDAKRRQSWRQAGAWLPLGFLIGAAAGLAVINVDMPAFVAGAADTHPIRVSGSGEYRLCGRASYADCVIDGDTIRFGGVKIRLADIDAPEVFSPKCASEAALGRRATQRLAELMNAGPFDVVHAGGRDEDIYGCKLRVIERGGRSVADTLVAEGLARRWDGARRGWCG